MEVKLMLYVIVTIVTISVILFIASFFMSNRFAHLEDLIEQESVAFSQDLFALKRKVGDLDDRIETNAYVIDSTGLADHTPVVTLKDYHLNEQELSFDEIAKRDERNADELQLIIQQR